MGIDECEYHELKNGNKHCRYFKGNISNSKDIDNCKNHCSLMEDKELMQDGIQPLVRSHGALRQKGRVK